MKNLEEKEYNNIYAIPANYTDSGKIFGGMLELRNTIEAALIVIIIGYPELMLIPMATTLRIVVMTVTLIPAAVIALMGIDGNSLFQYVGHMIRYFINRRNLHFRRVGYHYDRRQLRKKQKSQSQKSVRKSLNLFRTLFRLKI